MAEGNASVFDYRAIREALRAKGYCPIYHTAEHEAVEREAKKGQCPDVGWCSVSCDETPSCRIKARASAAP